MIEGEKLVRPDLKLGACGDRCDVCPRFVATEKNDTDLFERIMQSYVKIGLLRDNEPLESLRCQGCSPGNACAYHDVRDCVRARTVNNCGECSEYPCQKIQQVFEQTESTRRKFVALCGVEDLGLFEPAFFRKKMYLDGVAAGRSEKTRGCGETGDGSLARQDEKH